PGTLDPVDLAQVSGFDLSLKGRSLCLLPLCPAPAAAFNGEGGFKPAPEYTWWLAPDGELNGGLSRLLGEKFKQGACSVVALAANGRRKPAGTGPFSECATKACGHSALSGSASGPAGGCTGTAAPSRPAWRPGCWTPGPRPHRAGTRRSSAAE